MDSANYIDINLVGGGHAHAQVIKMWGMKPLPGVRLSLISPSSYTPYSGMLPGLVAGHYSFEQSHIDLRRLCQWANVRYINEQVLAVNCDEKSLRLAAQPDLEFDYLSINTGITPDLDIEGAKEYAIGVKPISQFYQKWQQLLQYDHSVISVVGAGIAGIELSLAMAERLKKENKTAKLQLIYPQQQLLPNAPDKLRKHLQKALDEYQVECFPNHRVNRFSASSIECLLNGETINLTSDFHLLCTQAKPANWAQESGIECDEEGFILLNDSLQSISHPWLFAAGDTAQQVKHPRPQAGVFAVRQGPTLFKNLKRIAQGKKLKQHKPQKEFLKLISLGKKSAAASRGERSVSKPGMTEALVWQWKNRIDRKFMAMFEKLPAQMPSHKKKGKQKINIPEDQRLPDMHCGGCGAKVAGDALSKILNQLKTSPALDQSNLGEDAARLNIDTEKQIFQSVDSFHGLVSDPFEQGRIATLHAMSDIFAMGGTAHSIQALISIAHAGENIVNRDLKRILQGILYELERHKALLIGGHSSLGESSQIGLVVNGHTDKNHKLMKSELREGEQLILSKALGHGLIFAGQQSLASKGPWLDAAIEQMLQSNFNAAQLAVEYGASACTDITGFGLGGHLLEMLSSSNVSANIYSSKLPYLEGVSSLIEQGVRSSLYPQNMREIAKHCNGNAPEILADPQTSGGLLMSISADKAEALINALKEQGYNYSTHIGTVIPRGEHYINFTEH